MKNKFLHYTKWIMSLLVLLPGWAVAEPAKLTDVYLSNAGTSARIEFLLDHDAAYRIMTLNNPERLVIDFPNTHLAMNLQKIQLNHSLLNSVRSGYVNASTLRLVWSLKTPVKFKAFAQTQKTMKIMLDLYALNAQKTPTHHVAFLKLLPHMIAKNNSTAPIIIAIDPGHGGKDPGAIGKSGTQEKNVVIAIARRLAELINQQHNMRAEFTRTGDYFVPLRERLKLARKGRADLFVSIHADSFFDDHSTGVSIYAISQHGATTEAARWLARRENYSELGGVDLEELSDKSVVLRSVLIDLAQTATITGSLRLGTSMLDSLNRVTELHYTRVEQAPFVVLKSPDIPSVLVETGFISNPSEEAKLRDGAYQEKIAQALFHGIQRYLKKYTDVQSGLAQS